MKKEKAMKKNLIKIVSVWLLFVAVILFIPSCGKDKKDATNSVTPGTAVYTFGYNNFGQGTWVLDLLEKGATYALESVGMKIRVVNNEFTVDKLIADAQNLIASKVDGLLVWSVADTLYPSFSRLCQDAKVPFVLGERYPPDDNTTDMLRKNPYYVGAIGTPDVTNGEMIARAVLAAGHKSVIIIAAAVGDTVHDNRIKGFTDIFEAGGGKVLGIAHCTDPSEAVQKSNDLLTAYPDVDCLYGLAPSYSIGALNAMEGRGIMVPIYATDVDPLVLKAIREDKILAANGGAAEYCMAFAAMLLVNYLDGHPILDENGQAPMTDGLKTVYVTRDNLDAYEAHWINSYAFSPEEFKKLCWRYNPDVTWKDYVDMIENYSFETRIATFK
jgi:ribose transport system substrate-binding protein